MLESAGPENISQDPWHRRLRKRLGRAAFVQELAAAGRLMKTEGVVRGLGGLILARYRVVMGCARPANWKRLKAHEGVAAVATGRAAAFFLFYACALIVCALATPVLILSDQNAYAVATGAFGLYSLQGAPVMFGQTLAYSALLPTPAMLAERGVVPVDE